MRFILAIFLVFQLISCKGQTEKIHIENKNTSLEKDEFKWQGNY